MRFALASCLGVLLLEAVLHALDWPHLGDEPVSHLLEHLGRECSTDVRWDPLIGVHPRVPGESYGELGTRRVRDPGPVFDRERLLLLGDSVVHRPGLFEPFAAELTESHAVFEAGVEGFDTQSELEWLRRYAVNCEPERVLLLMHVNDFWGNSQIYRDERGRLCVFHRQAGRVVVRERLLSSSRIYRAWLRKRLRPADDPVWKQRERLSTHFRALHVFCEERGIELNAALLPLVDPQRNEDDLIRGHMTLMVELMESLDVPYLDLRSALDRALEAGIDPGEDAEHPSPLLAEYFALELARWLLEGDS